MFGKRREERARLAELKEIKLFADCSVAELRAIDSMGAQVLFQSGTKLTCEGGAGLEFMVILAGVVRVSRRGRELAALGPGTCFGELSLITGTPRNATGAASTALRVLLLHAGEFARLLEISSVRARILRTAAERTVVRPRFSRKGSRIPLGSPRGLPA